MNKSLIFLFLLIALLSLSACMPSGDPITETYTSPLSQTEKIDIDLSSSDLEIIVEGEDQVTMTYRTYQRGPDLSLKQGKTLVIREENTSPFFIHLNQTPKLILTLPLTYKKNLSITTASGDVDLVSLSLESLSLQLSSGDLNIKELISEDITIDLSSGDVLVEKTSASRITLKSSSGDVDLVDVEGEISGRSSSGDVTLQLTRLEQDLTYDLSSGSFDLQLEEKPENVRFDLSCSSGAIDLAYTLDHYDKEEDSKVQGQIGEPRYTIEVDTSSGDIDIY